MESYTNQLQMRSLCQTLVLTTAHAHANRLTIFHQQLHSPVNAELSNQIQRTMWASQAIYRLLQKSCITLRCNRTIFVSYQLLQRTRAVSLNVPILVQLTTSRMRKALYADDAHPVGIESSGS